MPIIEKYASSIVVGAWFATFLLFVFGLPTVLSFSIMAFYGEIPAFEIASLLLSGTPFVGLAGTMRHRHLLVAKTAGFGDRDLGAEPDGGHLRCGTGSLPDFPRVATHPHIPVIPRLAG